MKYLLDTHALIFWYTRQHVSHEFTDFFDNQAELGNVLVSAVCFWEAALLVKKGRIAVSNLDEWEAGLSGNTNVSIISPVASEMIASVSLPDYHKDPFDRLLIVQIVITHFL